MSDRPRHIVIIARHYPPLISGGGRRVLLWVKALRALGVRVSVVAPILPEGEAGISVPHPQPEPDLSETESAKMTLKSWLREWLLYPDNDVRWCRRAARAAQRTWPDSIDWVMTTSPPESVHVAGRYLQKYSACRWHADIRDYWLEHPLVDIRRNPLRRRVEAQIAKRLLSRADLVTAVSSGMAHEAAELSGRDVKVLEHFVTASPARNKNLFAQYPKNSVHIVYTGAFEVSDPNRKLKPVLDVFSAAYLKNPRLFLHILGPLRVKEVAQLDKMPAASRCKYYGKVSFDIAREYQASADGLLISAAPGTLIVPGKLIEYQATGLPVIAIGSGAWIAETGFTGDPVQRLAAMKPFSDSQGQSSVLTAEASAQKLLSLMKKCPL